MKTSKNTITEPQLFVDDHHGVYMGQIAWQQLAERYKKQAIRQISSEDIASLNNGPDDEFYCDAWGNFEGIIFKTPTGQKLNICMADGGVWIIPACFRGKKLNDFFGN